VIQREVERALWTMREEFNHTLNALIFIHPQNTRNDEEFEKAYFKLLELLELLERERNELPQRRS